MENKYFKFKTNNIEDLKSMWPPGTLWQVAQINMQTGEITFMAPIFKNGAANEEPPE